MTNSYTHIQQTGVFADPINIYKLNRKFTNKELNFVKAAGKKAVRNATNKSSFNKYILNKPALNGLKNDPSTNSPLGLYDKPNFFC